MFCFLSLISVDLPPCSSTWTLETPLFRCHSNCRVSLWAVLFQLSLFVFFFRCSSDKMLNQNSSSFWSNCFLTTRLGKAGWEKGMNNLDCQKSHIINNINYFRFLYTEHCLCRERVCVPPVSSWPGLTPSLVICPPCCSCVETKRAFSRTTHRIVSQCSLEIDSNHIHISIDVTCQPR